MDLVFRTKSEVILIHSHGKNPYFDKYGYCCYEGCCNSCFLQQVFFVESVCDDPEVIAANILVRSDQCIAASDDSVVSGIYLALST